MCLSCSRCHRCLWCHRCPWCLQCPLVPSVCVLGVCGILSVAGAYGVLGGCGVLMQLVLAGVPEVSLVSVLHVVRTSHIFDSFSVFEVSLMPIIKCCY